MNPRAFQGTALRIEFGAYVNVEDTSAPPRNVVALFVGDDANSEAELPVRGALTVVLPAAQSDEAPS